MYVVAAPDKFKGSLDAPAVARAIARGVRRVDPGARVDLVPLADGGDGTIASLVTTVGGRVERVRVHGPLGAPVDAPLALLSDGRVVVEMAAASGLALLDGALDALAATSRGTGELLRAALERRGAHPGAVVVAVGGSASTDGGAGAASALGWRFLDRLGQELAPGGGALASLARVDGERAVRIAPGAVVAACDVDNPLLGPRGAARTFGPQKGAGDADVARLEAGLQRLAEVVARDVGIDVRALPHGGAGGGIGAGLVAFAGARLDGGFELVSGAAGLERAVAGADLVVTGEGRLDAGTLGGKVAAGVARVARAAGVPCVAVAGTVALGRDALAGAGIAAAAGLVEHVGERQARDDPAGAVADVVERLVRGLPW
ncbi:MAG TPA: glycerate kinase [Actinomycetota bacterium]|nr:glycerate kinase [Actinomycetota bacterium]